MKRPQRPKQSWVLPYLLGEPETPRSGLPGSERGLITAEGEEHPAWHVMEGISPRDGCGRWVCPHQLNSTQEHLMVPVPSGQDREILRLVPGCLTDLLLGLVQGLIPS